MVRHFAVTDSDAADIPNRLRFKGWIASAMRFARRVLDNLRTLVQTKLQPCVDRSDSQTDLSELTKCPDFPLERTTDLKLINPDWYLFFSVSPPLTLRGLWQ
ncbi:hypothetical protein [Nodosilinea sp. FACHB-13]|uniref:hypothetical protein n=1 Tax=Cyanophyceae TaxID=3028117 RepID=UPI001683B37C|nr:hypothetical protein [Nodosilinea sp. FACHB-13]MBD2107565.1 hypothetical protein [Nodosilinea sp. FACHB-13]